MACERKPSMGLRNRNWRILLLRGAFVLFPLVLVSLFVSLAFLSGYEGLGTYSGVVQWIIVIVPGVSLLVALLLRFSQRELAEKSRWNERANFLVSLVVLVLGLISLVIDIRRNDLEPLVTGSAYISIRLKPCELRHASSDPVASLNLLKGKSGHVFMKSGKIVPWRLGGRIQFVDFEFVLDPKSLLIGKPLEDLQNYDALMLDYFWLPSGAEILSGKCRLTLNAHQLKDISIPPQTPEDFGPVFFGPIE